MKPGGRLLACGNASGDWGHQIDSNQLWLRSIAVSGFNSGAYLPAHPQLVCPALQAALKARADGEPRPRRPHRADPGLTIERDDL
jgi:NADPH2:quinone reductase